MLADSVNDGGMVTQVVGADTTRRGKLTRASSELGVHRRRDVETGGAEVADHDQDRPTPLQVTSSVVWKWEYGK